MSNQNDYDEEVPEIMERNDLDQDTAQRVKEIMEEYDASEDEALELAEEGL